MDRLDAYNMHREDVGTFEQTALNKLNILSSVESLYRYFYILRWCPCTAADIHFPPILVFGLGELTNTRLLTQLFSEF